MTHETGSEGSRAGSSRLRRAWPALLFVSCFAGAAAAFFAAADEPGASGDSVRDLLIARDCAEQGRCAAYGAASKLDGFLQGALWPRSLALVWALGGGVAAMQWFVILAQAAAVALLAVAAGHTLADRSSPRAALQPARVVIVRYAAALFAALLYVRALVGTGDFSALWNPSLLPLFAVLATVALARLALGGGVACALAAGLFVALGVDTHLELVVLVPALLFLSAAHRRPLRALLFATAGAAVPLLASSWWMVCENVQRLQAQGLAWAALGGVALSIAAGLALRSRLVAARAHTRWAALALAVLLPYAAATFVLVRSGMVFELRYAHPVLPLGVILCARALALLWEHRTTSWRLLAPAAALAALLATTFIPARELFLPEAWRLVDGESLAPRIFADGGAYEPLKLGLEGPGCYGLVGLLAVHAPPAGGREPGAARSLVAARLPAALSEPARALGFSVVPLREGAVGVVRAGLDALDLRAMKVRTALPSSGGVELATFPIIPDAREYAQPEQFLFARRTYPESHSAHVGRTLGYEVTAVPRTRALRVDVAERAAAGCTWRFVARSIGGGPSQPLPAPAAEVALSAGSEPVRLELRQIGSAADCALSLDRRFPPCLLVTIEEDAATRALLLGRRS